MNKTIKAIIIGSSLAASGSASADIFSNVDIQAHTGYHSIYEFRGVDLGDNLITAGVDLSTEIASDLTLSGGVWYGASEGHRNQESFDELDLYFALTQSFQSFDLSVGYTHYGYIDGNSELNTSEWFVGISTETCCGYGFGLTFYRDLDTFEGSYLEAEVTKSHALNDDISLDFAAGISYSHGYNADVDGGSLNGLNSTYASVTAPWQINDQLVLAPYLKFVVADSDLASGENGDSNNLLLGGVSLNYAF